MFLKKLEIYGFKSFADRSRLEFSPGISSLLGPNGCGKSNIVDSIKWVLGEQSNKTLRAGKMEDVIFNGTESRKPLNIAEVRLTISNEKGLLPLDLPEIEIRRRIHRSGDSEYLINDTPVRLKEIRELFYDTGIGKSSYSVLEQGKIDQILSQKPEDRRYIFEEAAGITRYKQKSAEAESKLAKTVENINQVEQILKEVRRTYETRKTQAERAVLSRKLQDEIFRLEVEVQLSRVKELQDKLIAKNSLQNETEQHHEELQTSIDEQNGILEGELDLVNGLSKERIRLQSRILQLDEMRNGKQGQISLLEDRLDDFLHAEREAEDRGRNILERIERDRLEVEDKLNTYELLNGEIESVKEGIRTCEGQLEAAQDMMKQNHATISSEEERIREIDQEQMTFRKELLILTDTIVLEIERRLKESGYSYTARKEQERSIRAFLDAFLLRLEGRRSIYKDFADLGDEGLESGAEIRTLILKHLTETIMSVSSLSERFDEFVSSLPTFLDDLLTPEGTITRKREIDAKVEDNEQEIIAKRERISDLRSENLRLEDRVDEFRSTLEEMRLSEVDLRGRCENTLTLVRNLQRSIDEQEQHHAQTARDQEASRERQQEIRDRLEVLHLQIEELREEETSLRGDIDRIVKEIEKRNAQIQVQRESIQGRIKELSQLEQAIERLVVEKESLQHEMGLVYSGFEEIYSRSLKEFDSAIFEIRFDIQEIRTELRKKKLEYQGLGYINHMAVDEFAEVKERYEFLTKQMSDLEKAQADLRQITTEIAAKSEELFSACYARIKMNFHVMFRRLFGGGRAELRLVDPDNLLTTGIDILAQPPGKRLEKISLLSGGERSLTAVALLFATYMVKPSPFCILDEIDAALDDANIGHFLSVLQEFGESSQFIIITHNKKTVLGSSTLLGVTMEEPGVSKVVSYRLSDSAADS